MASNVTNALEPYKQPCSVTDPYCNWMILRSDKYHEYYLYNLGSKKFLVGEGSAVSLSETPMPIILNKSGDGFTISVKGKLLNVKATAQMPVVLTTATGANASP